MSIGLPAIPLLATFFAMPFKTFILDLKPFRNLPGLSHLDKFIVTGQILPIYRDFAKIAPYH
jgi:hypothetical protein